MYIAGLDPTERWTDDGSGGGNEFRVGQIGWDDDGSAWMHVHALGAISQFDVVLMDEAFEADAIDLTNSATGFGQAVGVANAAFADNDFGWVQIYGVVGSIAVETSAAANVELNSTAVAGSIDDDATVGAEPIIGLTLTTAESSGVGPGFITFPHVGTTL